MKVGDINSGALPNNLSYGNQSSENKSFDTKEYDSICAICLDEIIELENTESPQSKFMLDCGHEFHRGCIQKWIKVNNTCPIDRIELKKIEPISREVEQQVSSNGISGVSSDFFYPDWF